jgi:hypothetical protein
MRCRSRSWARVRSRGPPRGVRSQHAAYRRDEGEVVRVVDLWQRHLAVLRKPPSRVRSMMFSLLLEIPVAKKSDPIIDSSNIYSSEGGRYISHQSGLNCQLYRYRRKAPRRAEISRKKHHPGTVARASREFIKWAIWAIRQRDIWPKRRNAVLGHCEKSAPWRGDIQPGGTRPNGRY